MKTEAEKRRIRDEDALPESALTPEQLERRKNRLYKRKERAVARDLKNASTAETQQDWWQGNREALKQTDPEKLEAMLQRDSEVKDQQYWMQFGMNVPPTDPDFVSLEEGISDLVEFVQQVGTTHLGYIHREGSEIPHDWSSQKYWQDPTILAALENEGEATAIYTRLGLLQALPDWQVERFLNSQEGWRENPYRSAYLVGQVLNHRREFVYPTPGTNAQKMPETEVAVTPSPRVIPNFPIPVHYSARIKERQQ